MTRPNQGLSLAPYGRVGENPGNEVVFHPVDAFPVWKKDTFTNLDGLVWTSDVNSVFVKRA